MLTSSLWSLPFRMGTTLEYEGGSSLPAVVYESLSEILGREMASTRRSTRQSGSSLTKTLDAVVDGEEILVIPVAWDSTLDPVACEDCAVSEELEAASRLVEFGTLVVVVSFGTLVARACELALEELVVSDASLWSNWISF